MQHLLRYSGSAVSLHPPSFTLYPTCSSSFSFPLPSASRTFSFACVLVSSFHESLRPLFSPATRSFHELAGLRQPAIIHTTDALDL